MTNQMTSSRTPKFIEFRNCFEASMDFETAFECAGFIDTANAREVTAKLWAKWEAAAEG